MEYNLKEIEARRNLQKEEIWGCQLVIASGVEKCPYHEYILYGSSKHIKDEIYRRVLLRFQPSVFD